ncbi:hypothetical protein K7432_001557 [Basidiobolus ranarum]|uniref:Nudix hydrolase domain-containing protein n=1 Tax=Basidiobolus ranarum TaxID=34480 RepID=A0ABR2W9I9_9FUNG
MFSIQLLKLQRLLPTITMVETLTKPGTRSFTSGRSRDIITPEKYRTVAAVILKRKFDLNKELKHDSEDVHSVTRKPNESLYLLVKKPRPERAWQFPQGGVEIGETLVEAGKRELSEECGTDLKVDFQKSSPLGHIRYQFPDYHIQKFPDALGAEVYFMEANFISGQVKVDQDEIVDHAWLTKQEMQKYVEEDYYDNIKNMISNS